MKRTAVLALPVFAVWSLLPALASAQVVPPAPTPTATPATTPTPTPGTSSVEVVNGRRVYRYEFGTIYGEPQRPYAFTVTHRGGLGYTHLEDRRSFAPEVLSALRRAPF
ncbi:MAG: hypothetical protein HY909_12675 [Deltaproteobacteria bacterium]|nr:hypothetical protein [Deltaproteobacteria bacterium]